MAYVKGVSLKGVVRLTHAPSDFTERRSVDDLRELVDFIYRTLFII